MLRGKIEDEFREEVQTFVKEEVKNLADDLQGLERRVFKILKLKQDSAVFEVELANLKDETKRIAERAEEAMRKATGPHVCIQTGGIDVITKDVRDIRKALYGNRGLKISAVIALIVALFSGAAFIFSIRTDTAVTQSQLTDMKQDVVALQDGNESLAATMKAKNEKQDELYSQILFNLQSIDQEIKKKDEPVRRKKHLE